MPQNYSFFITMPKFLYFCATNTLYIIVKLTFLGTGTSLGVPIVGCPCSVCASTDVRDKRMRSSAMIEVDGKNIVIDTGPDFRTQLLNNHISRVDAILITHQHRDHLAGLDDIRTFNYMQRCAMPVYANYITVDSIKRDYYYCFGEPRYPGVPDIELHNVGDDPFDVLGLTVTPINVMHYKLPVLGFRIKNFTYITDASHIEECELDKIRGTKILVINALRKTSHLSHFSLPEALEVIEKVKPQNAYITHIGHEMGFHAETDASLPKGVHLAYDGLSIEF